MCERKKADHCYIGKVYVGKRDPYTEPYNLDKKDWVEVFADDIEGFKAKLSKHAGTRFRLHDRAKIKVMNYCELKHGFITMCRHNYVSEDNGIVYGIWMIG